MENNAKKNADPTEYDDDLERVEEEQSYADESDETPPSDIVAFNELRSCADLYRLYEAGQLEIDPDYQRDIVWPTTNQTRFIDSLAKQLPIPSMCISLDYKTEKRQVVDGLQRMSSIIKFLSEPNWRLSKLEDIDDKISNKTVEYIKKEYSNIYTRIENTTIPVTVLRCDLSKRSHQEYLFTIFHRLNSGGLKLTNQEIRNCIYTGPFNEALKELSNSDAFKNIMSIDKNRKYRYSNEELILRIFSFSESHEKYKAPLSKYLNSYMAKNRRLNDAALGMLKDKFYQTMDIIYNQALSGEPLPKLSKATIEAIFVGVIRNLEKINQDNPERIKEKYVSLRQDPLFSVDALKEGLASTENVHRRLDKALEIFSK